MNHPRAPSSATIRGQGAATPDSDWPDALSLKCGDILRIKNKGLEDQGFPQGQIVYITDWVSTMFSPTPYPGQAGPTQTDATVLYKFAKKVPVQDIVWYSGPDLGRDGAPKHELLSPISNLRGTQELEYMPGDKVYLKKALPVTYKAPGSLTRLPALEAGPGTRCFITKETTRIDRNKRQFPGSGTRSKHSIQNSYYQIAVKVSVYRWEEIRCGAYKEAGNFATISSSEVQRYLSRRLPNHGDPEVLSVTDEDTFETL